MIPATRQLRFLVAVRPGLLSPSVAARMTATLDRISEGRLLINVVTGGDPVENKGDGMFLEHDARYVVTREFLTVYKQMLAGEIVHYHGEHIRIEDGKLLFLPVQHPHPPLYFGGSSPAGMAVAAETIDKYLTWGEPPAEVAKKLEVAAKAAEARGRKFTLRHSPARHRARNVGAKPGRPPTRSSRTSTTRPSRRRRPSSRAWIPSARSACWRCTAAGATSSR